MLAADAHAFLAARGARVVALFLAEEHVLELVHPGVGEQQGRVVLRHQRRAGDDAVALVARSTSGMKPGSRSTSSCAEAILLCLRRDLLRMRLDGGGRREALAHEVGKKLPALVRVFQPFAACPGAAGRAPFQQVLLVGVAEETRARPPWPDRGRCAWRCSLPMTRRGPWWRTFASVRATAVAARRSSSVRWLREPFDRRMTIGGCGVAALFETLAHLCLGQLAGGQPSQRTEIGGFRGVWIGRRAWPSSRRLTLPKRVRPGMAVVGSRQ